MRSYERDSVVLDDRSIYWTVGIGLTLISLQSGATRILTTKPLFVRKQLELIQKYKINIFSPTASDFTSCLKYVRTHSLDLSSVRRITLFGGKFSRNFIADINRYFPNAYAIEVYGSTETGLISIAALADPNGNVIHVGAHRLRSNCITIIADENGNRLGPNQFGEIRVKTVDEFYGYLNAPIQTANAVDDEGFFRTGDTGRFDDDGFFVIGDRMKDIFRVYYHSTMLLPHEIEECLAKMSDIKDVCIVGIPITPGFYLPAAVVVRMPDSKLKQRDIFNMVAGIF